MNTDLNSQQPDSTTRHHRKVLKVGGSVAGAVAIAGVVTAFMLAGGSPASAQHHSAAPAAHGTTPNSSVTPANHKTPGTPGTPVGPINIPNNTPITPSPLPKLPTSQVETIQRQLGLLNYYEGPVNGVLNPQTIQAIEYLQRDAQLPQNGDFNQVTYLALQRAIAHGDNQMAG